MSETNDVATWFLPPGQKDIELVAGPQVAALYEVCNSAGSTVKVITDATRDIKQLHAGSCGHILVDNGDNMRIEAIQDGDAAFGTFERLPPI